MLTWTAIMGELGRRPIPAVPPTIFLIFLVPRFCTSFSIVTDIFFQVDNLPLYPSFFKLRGTSRA